MTEFSSFMLSMLWKREKLDYSFSEAPSVTRIASDIALAKSYIANFMLEPDLHRRAYAIYILFGYDRHENKLISVA